MQAKYKVERIFLKKFCKLQEGYLAQLNYYFLEQVSKLQAQSNIFKEICVDIHIKSFIERKDSSVIPSIRSKQDKRSSRTQFKQAFSLHVASS